MKLLDLKLTDVEFIKYSEYINKYEFIIVTF